MKNKGFNFWFNLFILIGMAAAVLFVDILEIQDGDVQIVKQIVISLGAIMGVVNTVLSANGNIWTFFFGVLDVLICSYANLDSGNMGQFLQHVLYFLPMQFVGFWQWKKRGASFSAEGGEVRKVRARRLDRKQWGYVGAALFVGTLVAYGILFWIDKAQMAAGKIAGIDNAKLILDAAVVVLNIIGQILMSLAFADQWYIWNLVNVFSILLWTNRLLSAEASSYTVVMVIKYVFYLLNSINGLRIWLHLSKHDEADMPQHGSCC